MALRCSSVILLITNKQDISVDFVVRELRRQNAEFLRLNTEDLPDLLVQIDFPKHNFVISGRSRPEFLSRDLRSILLRRPGKPFANLDRWDPDLPVARSFRSNGTLYWMAS